MDEYSASFNSKKMCPHLIQCQNFTDLKSHLSPTVDQYPHIAVLVPPYVQFKAYDIFVIVYEKGNVYPEIFAYQLKKDKKSCGNGTNDKQIKEAFWIRRKAHTSVSGNARYYVATSSELESFFGVSGNYWTPAVWEQLQKGSK